MGDAKGVLFVLTTIFLATECLAQPWFKGNYYTEQSYICEDELQTCMVPVSENPRLSHFNFTNYREITRNIGELCPLYPQIAACLRPELPQCEEEEIRIFVAVGLSIGDYICSLRGHSLMRDINKYSPCINSDRMDAIKRTIYSCSVESYLHTSTPPTSCQETRDYQKCAKKAIVQHCGVPAGEVVNEILNRIVSSLPQFGCVSNNTRTRKILGPGITLSLEQFI